MWQWTIFLGSELFDSSVRGPVHSYCPPVLLPLDFLLGAVLISVFLVLRIAESLDEPGEILRVPRGEILGPGFSSFFRCFSEGFFCR